MTNAGEILHIHLMMLFNDRSMERQTIQLTDCPHTVGVCTLKCNIKCLTELNITNHHYTNLALGYRKEIPKQKYVQTGLNRFLII